MKHKNNAGTDVIQEEYIDQGPSFDRSNIDIKKSNRLIPPSKCSKQCIKCNANLSSAFSLKRHLETVHKENVAETDAEQTNISSAPGEQTTPNAEKEDIGENLET